MSKQYFCGLCNNLFDFTVPQNKKVPYTTLNTMQQISQTTEVKIDDRAQLISEFKKCYLI